MKDMDQNKVEYKKYLPFIFIFSFSVFLSLEFWDTLKMPFHNPWDVLSTLTRLRFNPMNNILRYVILVVLPVIFMFLMYIINYKGSNEIYFKKADISLFDDSDVANHVLLINIFTVLFILYTLLYAVELPTYHASGPFDTFHEGETLGPAISYMNGLIPYKDYIFVHGIFQDPLRSVVAFKLFGKSIGSVRTLESIASIITLLLLTIFLIKVFHRNPLYVWIALFILSDFQMMGISVLFIPILIPPRDVTTLIFLLTISALHNFLKTKVEEINLSLFYVTIFVFSFVPIASFAYSIDRGFYLSATFLILYLMLYLFFFRDIPLKKDFLLTSLCGMMTAFLVFYFAARGAIKPFIDFAFINMPKYKELMDGFVFPIHYSAVLFVVLLITMDVFWIAYKLFQELETEKKVFCAVKGFLQKYFIEFTLMLLAFFFFRSALGRADGEHIAYSSFPAYLLFIIILLKYYIYPCFLKYTFQKKILYPLLSILLILVIWKCFLLANSGAITAKFPLQVKDAQYIPASYKPTIQYIKNRLKANESFFTMTSEASWYYFINKPCPTHFPVVWFAMPYFYQQEIVKDLTKNNVKYILYRNNSGADRIDGFSTEERLPIVNRYILSHYQYDITLNGNEIWVKKTSGSAIVP